MLILFFGSQCILVGTYDSFGGGRLYIYDLFTLVGTLYISFCHYRRTIAGISGNIISTFLTVGEKRVLIGLR